MPTKQRKNKKIFFIIGAYFFIFGFGLSVYSTVLADTIDLSTMTHSLVIGSRGKDVSNLQSFLQLDSLYNYPKITGYFGPITKLAVQRFQVREGIISLNASVKIGYGVVGPKTRTAINLRYLALSKQNNNIAKAPPVTNFISTTPSGGGGSNGGGGGGSGGSGSGGGGNSASGVHYVDSTNSTSGDGNSWANAWKSFADINWPSVRPGDIIYVSGGSTSQIYDETLNIAKSGTVGNGITITKGVELGHNGEVVIDGQNTRTNDVNFGASQYVKVSYITAKNSADNLILMRSSNDIVSHVNTFLSGGTSVFDIRGNNDIVEYVTSDESANGSFNGNGDFAQTTTGGRHIFRYNNITLRDANPNDHTDGLQFWSMDSGCEIYGNYIYHADTKTDNAQGIYITDSDNGEWLIYNNVLDAPYAKQMIALRNSQADFTAYSNTIYQADPAARGFWIEDDRSSTIDNLKIKNNIFYSSSSSVRPFEIYETCTSGCNVGGNLFYSSLNNPIYYAGEAYTVSEWNNLSFVETDFSGDPRFINVAAHDFHLQATSPAIDKGINLGLPYNVDKEGTSRPQGSTYDIGAYEFIGSGNTIKNNNNGSSFIKPIMSSLKSAL